MAVLGVLILFVRLVGSSSSPFAFFQIITKAGYSGWWTFVPYSPWILAIARCRRLQDRRHEPEHRHDPQTSSGCGTVLDALDRHLRGGHVLHLRLLGLAVAPATPRPAGAPSDEACPPGGSTQPRGCRAPASRSSRTQRRRTLGHPWNRPGPQAQPAAGTGRGAVGYRRAGLLGRAGLDGPAAVERRGLGRAPDAGQPVGGRRGDWERPSGTLSRASGQSCGGLRASGAAAW